MIVQKKVQRKFLEELDMQDLKLRFYGLLVEVHLREKDAFELAQVRRVSLYGRYSGVGGRCAYCFKQRSANDCMQDTAVFFSSCLQTCFIAIFSSLSIRLLHAFHSPFCFFNPPSSPLPFQIRQPKGLPRNGLNAVQSRGPRP